jgi:hypothetical protein
MIGELIRYWTTPVPGRVRRYGYLKRLIAIEFRERRCRAAWGPHLAQTRQYIVRAMDLVAKPRMAVILGSGLLLDVPLEDLAERFETVYLVDIFHMPHVRKAAHGFRNVKLLTGDLTGIFAAIKEGKTPDPLTPPPPALIPHLRDADMVVSCNCMTQLAGPFNDMFRKTQGYEDADCDRLSAQIMEHHIAALAKEAVGVGVLITDTQRVVMHGADIVSRKDLLKTVKLPHSTHPKFDLTWEWLIAPAPEEHRSRDYVHMVSARIYEHAAAQTESAPMEDGPADAEIKS